MTEDQLAPGGRGSPERPRIGTRPGGSHRLHSHAPRSLGIALPERAAPGAGRPPRASSPWLRAPGHPAGGGSRSTPTTPRQPAGRDPPPPFAPTRPVFRGAGPRRTVCGCWCSTFRRSRRIGGRRRRAIVERRVRALAAAPRVCRRVEGGDGEAGRNGMASASSLRASAQPGLVGARFSGPGGGAGPAAPPDSRPPRPLATAFAS